MQTIKHTTLHFKTKSICLETFSAWLDFCFWFFFRVKNTHNRRNSQRSNLPIKISFLFISDFIHLWVIEAMNHLVLYGNVLLVTPVMYIFKNCLHTIMYFILGLVWPVFGLYTSYLFACRSENTSIQSCVRWPSDQPVSIETSQFSIGISCLCLENELKWKVLNVNDKGCAAILLWIFCASCYFWVPWHLHLKGSTISTSSCVLFVDINFF